MFYLISIKTFNLNILYKYERYEMSHYNIHEV